MGSSGNQSYASCRCSCATRRPLKPTRSALEHEDLVCQDRDYEDSLEAVSGYSGPRLIEYRRSSIQQLSRDR